MTRKSTHVVAASVMCPLELAREALRLLLGYEVQFVQADVVIEREEEINFGAEKAVREARIKGMVISFRNPRAGCKNVEGVFQPYRGSYEAGAIQIKLGPVVHHFRYHRNWVPNPNGSPMTEMGQSIDYLPNGEVLGFR